MSQGSRSERIAEQIRSELALLLTREVHDPGLGFVTITRVQVTSDLQLARVYYTALGDEKAQKSTAPDRLAPAAEARRRARFYLRRVNRRPGPDRAASQRDSRQRTPPGIAGRRIPVHQR
jgi:ribosome-binding factor A